MKHRAFSRATGGAPFAIRKWRIARQVGLHLLGFLATVVFLAYLGPFGTWDALGIFDRLAFWSIAVGANWICAQFVFAVTIRYFAVQGFPLWAAVVLAGLVSAVPGTGAVWGVVAVYMDFGPFRVSALLRLYAQVAVIQLVVGFLVSHFIERAFERRGATSPSSSGSGLPHGAETGRPHSGIAGEGRQPREERATAAVSALLARLPVHKRGELHHLRMQDHYVEVHTDRGMEMVLLRFRDALREVEEVDGLQVHRSHWVARAAVERVERRDGRVTLLLVNGSTVPVSRSFAPALRARGWD